MKRKSSSSRTALRRLRHRRLRARVRGTAERPRLSVFRSARHLFAQLIDDDAGRTMLAVSDVALPRAAGKNAKETSPRVAQAYALGKVVAERAKAAGVSRVVFDRGGYAYHGRVRAVADGARKGGLEF